MFSCIVAAVALAAQYPTPQGLIGSPPVKSAPAPQQPVYLMQQAPAAQPVYYQLAPPSQLVAAQPQTQLVTQTVMVSRPWPWDEALERVGHYLVNRAERTRRYKPAKAVTVSTPVATAAPAPQVVAVSYAPAPMTTAIFAPQMFQPTPAATPQAPPSYGYGPNVGQAPPAANPEAEAAPTPPTIPPPSPPRYGVKPS